MSDPTQPADHMCKILTLPDQLTMTPKDEFSKYTINILRVVKFIFKMQSPVNMTFYFKNRSNLKKINTGIFVCFCYYSVVLLSTAKQL